MTRAAAEASSSEKSTVSYKTLFTAARSQFSWAQMSSTLAPSRWDFFIWAASKVHKLYPYHTAYLMPAQ
jgi:hypothetical protein